MKVQFRCHRVLALGLPVQHLRFRTRLRSRHQEPPQCRSPTPSRLLHCRQQGPNSHPRAAIITLLLRRRPHSTVRLWATARGTARTPHTTNSCGNTRTGKGGTKPDTIAPENMAEGIPEILGTPETRGSPEALGNRGMEAAEEEAKVLVTKRAKLENAGIRTQGRRHPPREH